jgi:hypothetical protein
MATGEASGSGKSEIKFIGTGRNKGTTKRETK